MITIPKGTVLPYLTAGWPTPDAFLAAVRGAAAAGCPAFEVGIPFTDPMADGPVIQKTSKEALDAGINFRRALELTRQAVDQSGIPAIAMTYCNVVFSQGLESSFKQLREAGVEGVILPDLTLEEAEPFQQAAKANQLSLIFLSAPTTPEARVKIIAEQTSGFLYLVSLKGVTGGRTELPEDLVENVRKTVGLCSQPVLVGFGISKPAQVQQLSPHCHGVVVGSALLTHLESLSVDQVESGVRDFLTPLVAAARA
jgi:tryptophan synthase alpha chain